MPELRKSRHHETIPMRVDKGALVPADGYAQMRLRERGMSRGEIVSVRIRRMREYWYHKWVHLFGQMVADNIEDFHGLTAHQVLKRLQAEALIGCEEMTLRLDSGEQATIHYPRSLAYDELDQHEFEQVFSGFCQHVIARYWPDLDQSQIAALLEVMDEEVA